jgi:hypothetical protein
MKSIKKMKEMKEMIIDDDVLPWGLPESLSLEIKKRSYTALFILILIFLGCVIFDLTTHYNPSQNNKVLHKSIQTKIVANKMNTLLSISAKLMVPQGMVAPLTWQHTSVIGTTDHPTLDGGIINAADGIPVSEPLTRTPNAALNIPKSNSTAFNSNGAAFADDWATSTKVKDVLERAAAQGKLSYVLNESNEKGMPASVALLPIIESAYQDNALSPKGAVGSWQLMPKTASGLGIDPQERTAFIPATNAALDYLNQLHTQFDNWELAYAAYNAGSQRVNEALVKNPAATSINALDLPQETKDYVYKLMQINQMLDN